jgi:hypothetical protein
MTKLDKWVFVEGATKSMNCTSWCGDMPSTYHNSDGTSVDGTTEFLSSLAKHSNGKIIHIKPNGLWQGKVEMFNTALSHLNEPCYLWEIDSDEYWTKSQMNLAEHLVENTKADTAAFACDYLLSDDIIVRGEWGESPGHGYRRLWKYQPGMKFLSHEPPVLSGCTRILPPRFTPKFLHKSYYFEKDVLFKSKWYGKHEQVYDNWKKIVTGEILLPVSVSALFGRNDLPKDWMESIITYR